MKWLYWLAGILGMSANFAVLWVLIGAQLSPNGRYFVQEQNIYIFAVEVFLMVLSWIALFVGSVAFAVHELSKYSTDE